MTEVRQGPTPHVCFREVSAFTRCLSRGNWLYNIANRVLKLGRQKRNDFSKIGDFYWLFGITYLKNIHLKNIGAFFASNNWDMCFWRSNLSILKSLTVPVVLYGTHYKTSNFSFFTNDFKFYTHYYSSCVYWKNDVTLWYSITFTSGLSKELWKSLCF